MARLCLDMSADIQTVCCVLTCLIMTCLQMSRKSEDMVTSGCTHVFEHVRCLGSPSQSACSQSTLSIKSWNLEAPRCACLILLRYTKLMPVVPQARLQKTHG